MTELEVQAALSSAHARDQEVELTTTDCAVRCCGGHWRDRLGRQTYVGKVSTLGTGHVVLRWAPLGRINEMLTAVGFIEAVQSLSQEAPSPC